MEGITESYSAGKKTSFSQDQNLDGTLIFYAMKRQGRCLFTSYKINKAELSVQEQRTNFNKETSIKNCENLIQSFAIKNQFVMVFGKYRTGDIIFQ